LTLYVGRHVWLLDKQGQLLMRWPFTDSIELVGMQLQMLFEWLFSCT